MSRTAVSKLVYVAALLAIVAVTMPFVTPDMPWWGGLAVIVGFFAVIGVSRVIEDAMR